MHTPTLHDSQATVSLAIMIIRDNALSATSHSEWSSFIRARVANFFPTATVIESESLASIDAYAGHISDNTAVALLSSSSPLFDERLLAATSRAACTFDRVYAPVGAIPGTYPKLVGLWKSLRSMASVSHYFWESQGDYNTNLNIVRPKREKLFKALGQAFSPLHSQSINDVLTFLSSQQGVDFAISYGESVTLQHYSSCPLCGCHDIQPLKNGSGHASIGFLTARKPYYFHCLQCTVVFLNPQMGAADLWRYYDQASYGVYDNVEHEWNRLHNLNELNTAHLANYRAITHILKQLQTNSVVIDLGAGGGEFCSFAKSVRDDIDIRAVDHRINQVLASVLEKMGIRCTSADFILDSLELPKASLITNWEVVEHIKLELLGDYFKKVADSIAEDGYYVLSTPDFLNYYTHALDFWSMAPGEHISVLSRPVLEPLLRNAGLIITEEYHECATMRVKDRWFQYGAANHSSLAARAESQIIEDLLQDDDLREQFRARMRERNVGSELILVCRKNRW